MNELSLTPGDGDLRALGEEGGKGLEKKMR